MKIKFKDEREVKMNIKLVVTDLDNTLLRNDKTISDYSAKIFRKCKDYGIMTSVATARYITGIQPFIGQILPDYQITNDGTMIFHNEKLLHGFYMELNSANEILNIIKKENPDGYISVVNDDGIFRKFGSHNSASPNTHESPSFTCDFDKPLSKPPFKIVMECFRPELAADIVSLTGCRMITYRNENRYAFISNSAGKVNAIKELTLRLNISLNEVAVFGDDINDIDMISECGYGIAVANAIDEVKNIADYITDTNENDGVAKFMEHNFLNI